MINTPPSHHRRSIRLKGYDYTSEGGYFITLVTHERQNLFGVVENDEMHLNPLGGIARDEWFRTAQLRSYVELFDDEFIVMPNHIHGIIWITGFVGAYCNTPLPNNTPPPNNTPLPDKPLESMPFRSPGIGIGAIIRGYKSAVTKRINLLSHTPSTPVWQRNYYEHIITTDREYEAIAEYIYFNPLNWGADEENVASRV